MRFERKHVEQRWRWRDYFFLTNPLCQHHHETFPVLQDKKKENVLYNVLMVKTN